MKASSFKWFLVDGFKTQGSKTVQYQTRTFFFQNWVIRVYSVLGCSAYRAEREGLSAGGFFAMEWRLDKRQILKTKYRVLKTFLLVLEHVERKILRKAFD